MDVKATGFTLAEYCQQMEEKSITVDHRYQRSPKVWPTAARSFLIDTILRGYPMPKLCLRQITDLKTRRTRKEIVDGQQRSTVIFEFYSDKFRISGQNNRACGLKFSQLDDDLKEAFLGYTISVDLFVGADESEIREVFRRINSYTVPLNDQEKRHAIYQGEFKWFIADLSKQYSQLLKNLQVFNENQLTRMSDSVLLTDLTISLVDGLFTSTPSKLTSYYKLFDGAFEPATDILGRIDEAFAVLLDWEPVHGTVLMKPYVLLCLLLAITHVSRPVEALQQSFEIYAPVAVDPGIALVNLTSLAEILEAQETVAENNPFHAFVASCSQATNTKNQRNIRFQWMCRALTEQHLA